MVVIMDEEAFHAGTGNDARGVGIVPNVVFGIFVGGVFALFLRLTSDEYAPRAVHLHPNGGQSDSVWLSAPHVRIMGVHRTCGAGEPNETKKNTHPENTTALHRGGQVPGA